MALSLHIDRIDEQMNTLLEHGLAKSVNYDSGNMVKARQSCSTESASKWCHVLVENLQPTLPPPHFLSRLRTGQNAFRVKS